MDTGSCESWAKKSETNTSMDEDERLVIYGDPDAAQPAGVIDSPWASTNDSRDAMRTVQLSVVPKAEPPRRSMPREAAIQPPWRVKSLKDRKRILARIQGK